MKADWNDAPEYIRTYPRKRSAAAWVIPGFIGTVIVLGALQVAGSAFLKGTAQSIVDRRIQPKAPIAEITRAEPAATKDWDKVVRNVADQSGQVTFSSSQRDGDTPPASGKQTVYNDNNYIPQGANNVIPAVSTYQSIEITTPKKKQELVIVGKESRLRDLCPYRQGSIERRNCKMRVDLNR